MRRPHRTFTLASLLAILLTLLGANAASAEDRPPARSTSVATQAPLVSDTRDQDNSASPLADCHDGAQRWDAGYIKEPKGYENRIPGPDDQHDGDYYYRTSTNCQHINMRLVNYLDPTTVRVCFDSPAIGCDPEVTVQGSGWHVISSPAFVPDGWVYHVEFTQSYGRRIGDIAD